MVFLTSQIIYLIRKMGEGKSLIITITLAVNQGITIVIVPLIGLGIDQVNKAINLDQSIEVYHVDENCGDDFLSLTDCLLSIEKRDIRPGPLIVLYCLPQSLGPTTKLSPSVMGVAWRMLNEQQYCWTVFCGAFGLHPGF